MLQVQLSAGFANLNARPETRYIVEQKIIV
jgi:hypothetical protein